MLREWDLHFARWVIEDGHHNRHVGDVFTWYDVEFYSEEPLIKVSEQPRSAASCANYRHQVVAEVAYVCENACVIDFGIRAISFRDVLPRGAKQGDFVMGEVSLCLTFGGPVVSEEVSRTLGYQWQVERITADLTPYSPDRDDARHLIRDDAHERYENVESTDSAIGHDYILHCSVVSSPTA